MIIHTMLIVLSIVTGYMLCKMLSIKKCPVCGRISYCVPLLKDNRLIGKCYICTNVRCNFIDHIQYEQYNSGEVVRSLNYRGYNTIVFKCNYTIDSGCYYLYVIKDMLGNDVERGWVSYLDDALRTAKNLIDDDIEMKMN